MAYPVSILAVALVHCVIAFRSVIASRVRVDDLRANSTDGEEVDFSFMTKDLRYVAHEAGFFGTISEWFGGRATSDDVKEEIVTGHACAKRGNRDETYYASSFCYWLPEFSERSARRQDAGLVWKGGRYPNGKKLGGKVDGSGKCLKVAACHNNAHAADGDVNKQTFVEEIRLPSECLKEQEIERRCVSDYDTEAASLKAEDGRCHGVQGRWDHATDGLNKCMGKLDQLPREIEVLPGRIRNAENQVIRLDERFRSARERERSERQQMHRRCETYQRRQGNLRFMNMLMGSTPTEQILSFSSFYCSWPHQPMDNHDGRYWDEMARYRNNLDIYNACQECEAAKKDLKRANSQVNSASNELARATKRVPQLKQELRETELELYHWRAEEPGLRHAKETMDRKWLPQKSKCQTTYADYKNGKAKAVSKCAPTYYPASCEKVCVELQAEDGCGIIEGTRPNDDTGGGGIEVTCAPPQPSWILGPFTYGSREQPGKQCERIQANQHAQYAQTILKTGWLWKKGRVGGWDKRFYVMESGDAVRSAVLRYWREDPTKISNAEERAGKGIILRDATGVKVKSGTHYGFENGEECFKLYHFYRDFRFCTVTSEDEGVARKGGASTYDRDQWIELLEQSIAH